MWGFEECIPTESGGSWDYFIKREREREEAARACNA